MSKYVCEDCKKEFNNPLLIRTTYERFYGISGSFDNSTSMNLEICPYCKSTDIFCVNNNFKKRK